MAKKYFARIDGRQVGPIDLDELAQAGVTPDTYIWCKGMADWTRARHDAEVCRMFRQRLAGINHPDDIPLKLRPDSDDTEPQPNIDSVPPRFRGIVERSGTEVGPPDEKKPDYSVAPRSYIVEAVMVTLLCSILGVVAIYFAYAARRAWAQGKAREAYDFTRSAKMWIGISFFIGIIGIGFILRNFMG